MIYFSNLMYASTDHGLLYFRYRGHTLRHGLRRTECAPSPHRWPFVGERATEAALRSSANGHSTHPRADVIRNAQDNRAGEQTDNQRTPPAEHPGKDAGCGGGEEEAVVCQLHA